MEGFHQFGASDSGQKIGGLLPVEADGRLPESFPRIALTRRGCFDRH
jgi:hypothetical protein